ncbi:CoA-transferase family III domain-containing protein [Powellomyces hirtus]|nr:CoA-transferase family III domain-containing protein [Powellomyces hirtus]
MLTYTHLRASGRLLRTGSFPSAVCFLRAKQVRTKSTTTATTSAPLPLEGIKVLDLTRVLAGPYCSMILGDYGAEILKIEHPNSGDDTRVWGPPFARTLSASDAGQPDSAYFLGNNRNKRSITVNLKHPRGVDVVKRLAKECDVLIENYVPGKMDAWGLGWEVLRGVNERLVYASITGYGPDGPYAHKPGYDVITEAEAGLMHITGEPDGPPVKVGVAITDMTTGLYAHGAIMAALLARARTGLGQKLDISLLECQVASLANIAHSYLIGGEEGKRWGTQHAAIVPYQAFRTRDAYIVVGAATDAQFGKLCTRLDRASLATSPHFSTNAARVTHRVELIALLSAVFRAETTDTWLRVLDGVGIPFAPVNSIRQTFEHPQVLHREMIQEVDHPRHGTIKLVGIPVKFSHTKPSIRRPPPVLGQHTKEVLTSVAGYSEEEVEGFVRDGVV